LRLTSPKGFQGPVYGQFSRMNCQICSCGFSSGHFGWQWDQDDMGRNDEPNRRDFFKNPPLRQYLRGMRGTSLKPATTPGARETTTRNSSKIHCRDRRSASRDPRRAGSGRFRASAALCRSVNAAAVPKPCGRSDPPQHGVLNLSTHREGLKRHPTDLRLRACDAFLIAASLRSRRACGPISALHRTTTDPNSIKSRPERERRGEPPSFAT
jgi:hypothetical protein